MLAGRPPQVPKPDAAGGRWSLAAFLIFVLIPAFGRSAVYSIAGFSDTAVVTTLNQPTAFTWTPDGRMLVLEKPGRVRVVVNGVLQPTAALDLSASVDSDFEKGMLGITLHPAFAMNGFVYLYYTNRIPQNRISLFTMTGNTLDPMSETVILDHIDATNGNHNGGNIQIGPDGKLWAAPGDSGTGGAKSQNLSVGSFNGKVLRMELNGSPATGNPFLGDTTKEPRIWAYGFRNPWRWGFRPSNGSLYVADVGQDTREEIDVVTAGGNYGWPLAEGTLGGCTGCIPPVFEYDHPFGEAIIGGVFAGPIYPASLRGKYVFGDEVSSWIKFLDFASNDTVVGQLQDFATSAEAPVHFATGPDGAIYYAAIASGKIYRINPPPTSFFTVTPCRVADTRDPAGPSGGPALAAGSVRTFPVAGRCGIPASASAVVVNLVAVQPTNDGDLRVYPAAQPAPLASSINFRAGLVRANNASVPLGASGQLSVQCDMPSGGSHFLFDVYGYYQ